MNLNRIIDFFKLDLWRIMTGDLSKPKLILIKFLRIATLTLRHFIANKDSLRTSALAYYSVLSIVPVFAMVFGIAKGFGFEKVLERLILGHFSAQEEVAAQLIRFARALLANVKGEVVAGIGVVILFYTIVKILTNIEDAFNSIWRVPKARSIMRKTSNYLSFMLICPVLFLFSSTLTVLVTSQAGLLGEKIQILALVRPAIFLMLKLLPYVMLWLLFTFLYLFMPNTRVRFRSGLAAGIIAGTLYQLFQWGYINLQIGVAQYNAVYGSFAAIPLFCIWLQTSWLIVLFGAEISYAYQNTDAFLFEKDCLTVSQTHRRLLSLRVMHLLVKTFCNREPAQSIRQITETLGIPSTMVRQIIYDLTAAGLISEVIREQGELPGFQPALDPDDLTIQYVIERLDQKGNAVIPVNQTPDLEKIQEALQAFNAAIKGSPHNILLKQI